MTTVFLSASDVKIGDAALYAVVGFVIVIAVLALLVAIFYLSGFIFRTKALSRDNLFERKSKKKPAAEAAPETQSDEETVAVITAAITLMLSEESDDDVVPEFVIRRVTRK